MNTVNLIGNLTRDPEVKQTKGGTELASLRVAFNTRAPGGDGEWGDKSNFIDVTVFGRQVPSIEQYLEKGKKVGITGRLDWREWEDKDGNKRQAIQIIATDVQFLSPRDGDTQTAKPKRGNDLPVDDVDDDIPF
jgi:single-strand DNA-binding protein